MAVSVIKMTWLEDGVPTERDPATAIGAVLPQAPIVRQGQPTTAGAVLANASVLSAIVGQDATWTIPATTTHVVVPSPTASRTWSLPDVDGYPYGQDLVIADEGRFLGSGPTVTLVPLAGSGDAIRDYPNGIIMQDAGMTVRLRRGLLSDVWILASGIISYDMGTLDQPSDGSTNFDFGSL